MFDANLSAIKTHAGEREFAVREFALSDLKDLVQRVNSWLAGWASSDRGSRPTRSSSASQHTLHTLAESEYQKKNRNRKLYGAVWSATPGSCDETLSMDRNALSRLHADR